MADTYFDPNSTGVLMPQVAAAAQRDPRRLLVQSIMGIGQQQLNQPTYSFGAALAKALTGGIGGLASAELNQDYQNQNQQVQDTMRRAIEAGQGTTDPTTGQATAGDPSEMVKILASNPLTAPQAMQFGLTTQQMRAKALIDRQNELIKQGKWINPATGQMEPLPGAVPTTQQLAAAQSGGSTMGTNAANAMPGPGGQAAVINATAGAKANAAAMEEAAKNPALIARAVGTAAGTAPIEVGKETQIAANKAPIEVFKNLFNPVVDRTTGEVTIPGLDTAVSAKVMQAMNLNPKDVAASIATGPGAQPSPGAQPGPQNPAGTPQTIPAAPQTTGAAAQPPQVVPPAAPGEEKAPAPPNAAPANAPPVPYGTKSPTEEVPKVDLPTGLLPGGPGTLIRGRDPVAIKAGEEAVNQANEQYHETQKAAAAAQAVHAQLGTMRSEVQNGGVTPSATAPARYLIAGYLNATLGPEVAKSVTGLDPASADVVNKEATRMGLTYARQTEGAREAVAGINIALKGNPQLGNTKEGFMKILDLIDAGAQRDLAAQQYGDAFFDKNKHYVGFQGWFNQNHPVAEFTSKVVPYNAPRAADGSIDASKLQPNVTYQGANGPGIWTGHGFIPVK